MISFSFFFLSTHFLYKVKKKKKNALICLFTVKITAMPYYVFASTDGEDTFELCLIHLSIRAPPVRTLRPPRTKYVRLLPLCSTFDIRFPHNIPLYHNRHLLFLCSNPPVTTLAATSTDIIWSIIFKFFAFKPPNHSNLIVRMFSQLSSLRIVRHSTSSVYKILSLLFVRYSNLIFNYGFILQVFRLYSRG